MGGVARGPADWFVYRIGSLALGGIGADIGMGVGGGSGGCGGGVGISMPSIMECLASD